MPAPARGQNGWRSFPCVVECDVFRDLPGVSGLFQHAQGVAQRLQGMTEELRAARVRGSAGGGMVQIEFNGLAQAVHCQVDPTLLRPENQEMLEELVTAAVNQAIAHVKQLHGQRLRQVTRGLPLPGLDQLMARFFAPEGEGPDAPEPKESKH